MRRIDINRYLSYNKLLRVIVCVLVMYVRELISLKNVIKILMLDDIFKVERFWIIDV